MFNMDIMTKIVSHQIRQNTLNFYSTLVVLRVLPFWTSPYSFYVSQNLINVLQKKSKVKSRSTEFLKYLSFRNLDQSNYFLIDINTFLGFLTESLSSIWETSRLKMVMKNECCKKKSEITPIIAK